MRGGRGDDRLEEGLGGGRRRGGRREKRGREEIQRFQRFIDFSTRQINAIEKNICTKHMINSLVFTNCTITYKF